MQIELYSKPNCPFCDSAKALLAENNIAYTERQLGRDLTRDEFMQQFPNVRTVPYIIIDGVGIGGYNELPAYITGEVRGFNDGETSGT